MNKKALWIIGAILAVIFGSVIYLLNQPKDMLESTVTSTPATHPESKTEMPTASTEMSGKYVDYSSNVIADTKGTKILFFHAPWCPQCRALEADIKATKLPSDTTVIKVDYDTNQSLRKKYGATMQTTLVLVDDQGQLVKKYVAYHTPTWQAVKENLL